MTSLDYTGYPPIICICTLHKHELDYRLTLVVQATCANGVGITSAKCDNSSLPPNALFKGNAAYNQPRGCEW